MGLFKVGDVGATSGHGGIRQLDAKVGQACLTIRAAASGVEDAAGHLDLVERQLLPECRALARALAARGQRRRVSRLLHSRRKLASLVARGDVELLWRYVAFIDAIREEVRTGPGPDAADGE